MYCTLRPANIFEGPLLFCCDVFASGSHPRSRTNLVRSYETCWCHTSANSIQEASYPPAQYFRSFKRNYYIHAQFEVGAITPDFWGETPISFCYEQNAGQVAWERPVNGHDLHLGTWASADLSHLGNTTVDWATPVDCRHPRKGSAISSFQKKPALMMMSPSRAPTQWLQRSGLLLLDPGRVLSLVRGLSAAGLLSGNDFPSACCHVHCDLGLQQDSWRVTLAWPLLRAFVTLTELMRPDATVLTLHAVLCYAVLV